MNKAINISYRGTVLTTNQNKSIFVCMTGLRNNNCETEFKEIDPLPMVIPLLDNKVKVKVGYPIFVDICDEGDIYKIDIGIPDYGAFIKFVKKGSS